MWIYADNRGNILGSNPNDMKGNSGWAEADGVPAQLANSDGIPLYKLEKGKAVLREAADVGADKPIPEETKQAKSKADYAKNTTDKQRLDFMARYMGLTNGSEK